MADDTPQKMIDAKKRKLQTQAFDDPFMAEMKAAEEKGDLPPARVRVPQYLGAEIVQGEKGGETPTQMASTLDARIQKREADIDRVSSKVSAIKRMPGFDDIDHYDLDQLIRLVGQGRISFSLPEAQAAAIDAYNDSIKSFGGESLGVEEHIDIERDRSKLQGIEEEFPQSKLHGPKQK